MAYWYAVYTSSRAEKRVKERLEQVGIECYLPLRTEFRMWSSRKKKVSVPLILSANYRVTCTCTVI